MNIKLIITKKIKITFVHIGIPHTYNPNVQQSNQKKFGDYQVNGIMNIAKKLNINPYTLACKITSSLKLKELSYKIEVLKPGFINIFLKPKWIEQQINLIIHKPKLGVSSVIPQTIVIDYSSPNIAKQMHIGHLRSTIIGDSIARTLSFLGHNIIRSNHIGDWGTQFGMIIAYSQQNNIKNIIKNNINIEKLEEYYQKAKEKYDKDPNFAQTARNCVVKLQNGDVFYRQLWKRLINITLKENQKIYKRLNVSLTSKDIIGESFYHKMIPEIIKDLKNKKLATVDNGATVVHLDHIKNKQGKKMGVIIQKQDGSYLYATTDIACIKYRSEILKADKILYYTDYRQHQHLNQVLNIANKAGYINQRTSVKHHMFGMILNKNGQPFKTRSGKTIKISTLLDEGLKKAYNIINKKNNQNNKKNLKKIAQRISIGAIKYSDLSRNRITNYIFDWNKILNFEGNTAPYIQYAFTRIISILKKNKKNHNKLTQKIKLISQEEISLALCILRFEENIKIMIQNGTPHVLCNYLHNLATLFSSFYEKCPILNINNISVKYSRLKLSIITSKILKQGLNLLGIETIEKM